MEISKIVIPAAGLGTRFLPFTKAIAKEMLPLINKPAIQHIIEEALQSEIAHFLVITGRNKHALADHFEIDPLLQQILTERQKNTLLTPLEKIIRLAHMTYITQSEPLGLGHAIWLARHSIHKEYFCVALADDIIINKQPALSQLIRIARQEKASVIAVQEVPTEYVSSYGIVSIKKQITPNLFQLSNLIEKPHAKDAPSNLAVVGRYVLSHKIFNSIEHVQSYAQGEIQLTDAIAHMMQNNERVFAYKIQGTRYDIGTPIGWIKAIIGSALQDSEYAPQVKKFLQEMQSVHALYNPAKPAEHEL
jgi:UTP--glucose-1-phosphate uridylyltransferase